MVDGLVGAGASAGGNVVVYLREDVIVAAGWDTEGLVCLVEYHPTVHEGVATVLAALPSLLVALHHCMCMCMCMCMCIRGGRLVKYLNSTCAHIHMHMHMHACTHTNT